MTVRFSVCTQEVLIVSVERLTSWGICTSQDLAKATGDRDWQRPDSL